jgi:hypothetical protein
MNFSFHMRGTLRTVALLAAGCALVAAVALMGRLTMYYSGADLISKIETVSLQPYPGKYEIESKDKPFFVSMMSMIGADIWYTDDGSNPVSGKWLNLSNKNLKHYGGFSIPVSKTTTFRVVGITVTGLMSDVQTASYSVTIKPPVVPKVEPVSKAAAPSTDTLVSGPSLIKTTMATLVTQPKVSTVKPTAAVTKPITTVDLYKLRAAEWNKNRFPAQKTVTRTRIYGSR